MAKVLIIRFLTDTEQGNSHYNLFLHGRSFENEMRQQAPCLEGNLGDDIRQHTSNHNTARNEKFKILEQLAGRGTKERTPTRMVSFWPGNLCLENY